MGACACVGYDPRLVEEWTDWERKIILSRSQLSRPMLILANITSAYIQRQPVLEIRLKSMLSWAIRLVPEHLTIVELRAPDADSALPLLLSDSALREKLFAVSSIPRRQSSSEIGVTPRAMVCGGVLEELLYPCHELKEEGFVTDLALCPALCGSSGRSGELPKADLVSHFEEVLGVTILSRLKSAVQWLVPSSNLSDHDFGDAGALNITMEGADSDEPLTADQENLLSLVFRENVSGATLRKIGKDWSSALKFFCVPLVAEKNTRMHGAMTLLKIGPENEVEHEMNLTNHMSQLLGSFTPKVLGYAELGDTAAMQLSLPDLGGTGPDTFTNLFEQSAGNPLNAQLLHRLELAVDFVFGTLCPRLHWTRTSEVSDICVADEIGLCKDIGGSRGVEPGLHMRSAWALEKVWKRAPGDGNLNSSVRAHFLHTFGETSHKDEHLCFLEGNPLRLPNLCSYLLDDEDKLQLLRETSICRHNQCFVHGDLHGDNIMIDAMDNRFMIDFRRTGLGHSLEDVTWLESFVLLSYTQLNTDSELSQVLDFVPALAPGVGLSASDWSEALMERNARTLPTEGGLLTTWAVVKRLRQHLCDTIRQVVAGTTGGDALENLQKAELVAVLLFLRNCLFFLAAKENKNHKRKRVFCAALACAYATLANRACHPEHPRTLLHHKTIPMPKVTV